MKAYYLERPEVQLAKLEYDKEKKALLINDEDKKQVEEFAMKVLFILQNFEPQQERERPQVVEQERGYALLIKQVEEYQFIIVKQRFMMIEGVMIE